MYQNFSYDLREYNGTRLITKATTYSKHVNSKLDGSWTKLYVPITSIPHTLSYFKYYNFYIQQTEKFMLYVCRSSESE